MSMEAITAARKLRLPPRDKFVLLALADYANDNAEAYPKQSTIAEWTCYARQTVNEALNSLEAAGLIQAKQTYRDDGGKSVKVYRLTFVDTPHVSEDDMGMSARTTRACRPGRQPHVSQDDSKNPQEGTPKKEPKKHTRAKTKTTRRRFDPASIPLPDFVSRDWWEAFTQHRKDLGKPLTEQAAKLTLDKLAKAPLDADAMLRTSIERGWTGVFPLDKPTRKGAATSPALDQYTERGL